MQPIDIIESPIQLNQCCKTEIGVKTALNATIQSVIVGINTSRVGGMRLTQITGGKKQSEAALFTVRVDLPCYMNIQEKRISLRKNIASLSFDNFELVKNVKHSIYTLSRIP